MSEGNETICENHRRSQGKLWPSAVSETQNLIRTSGKEGVPHPTASGGGPCTMHFPANSEHETEAHRPPATRHCELSYAETRDSDSSPGPRLHPRRSSGCPCSRSRAQDVYAHKTLSERGPNPSVQCPVTTEQPSKSEATPRASRRVGAPDVPADRGQRTGHTLRRRDAAAAS